MDKLILLSSVMDPILTRVSDADQAPPFIHEPLLHGEGKGICETIGGQPIVPGQHGFICYQNYFHFFLSHHSRNTRKRPKSEQFSLQTRPQFTIPAMYFRFITEERVNQRLKCIIMGEQRNPGDMW